MRVGAACAGRKPAVNKVVNASTLSEDPRMESSNLPDDNPFAAPTVLSRPVVTSTRPRLGGLLVSWLVVFIINLPLPFMWGWTVTEGNGTAGMIVGCIAVLVAGFWLCRDAPYFMIRLCIGAVPVAVSQFFPMLQMFTGIAAMWVTRLTFHLSLDGPGKNMEGIAEVAFCTFLTGLELISVSLALGYLAGLLLGLPTAPKEGSVTT